MYNSDDKMVQHPAHYQSAKGIEVIDVIEAFTSDMSGIEAFNTGNIIKYICRWKHKNGIQDLEKAKWYLDDLITRLSQNANKPEENENTQTVCAFLDTWEDAWTIYINLQNALYRYGNITLADFYVEVATKKTGSQISISQNDSIFGWTDISGAVITDCGENGIKICMPEPKNIYGGV